MQLGLPVLSWPRHGQPLRLPRRPQILAPGESPPPGGAGLRRLHARSRRRPLPERRENAPRARQPVDPLGRRALPDLTSGMFTPEKPAPKWAAPSRLHSTARSCRPACRRRERRQLRQGPLCKRRPKRRRRRSQRKVSALSVGVRTAIAAFSSPARLTSVKPDTRPGARSPWRSQDRCPRPRR